MKRIRFRIDVDHIKPYVRMTQKGKYVDPQAQEYLASKAELQIKMVSYMSMNDIDMLPAKTPLNVTLDFIVPSSQGHRADCDNLIKAVIDAGNGILYPDDRWIDVILAERSIGDNPGVYIFIETLDL